MLMEYPDGFRTQMIQRMTGPTAQSANSLAAEAGVSQGTLSRWLREAGTVEGMKQTRKRSSPKASTPSSRRPQDWSAEEKLRAVREASGLSDDELGAFLRREGLREAHLDEWRKVATDAATTALRGPSRREKKEANKEKLKIRALERELRRKEKALAEAAALLVLQKKVRRIFEDEDDDTSPGSER